MTVDPSKLYAHLPPAYDRSQSSDQHKLMKGLEAGYTRIRTEITSLENEQTLSSGTGDGLDRRVESRGLFRPPGMNDTQLRALSIAIVKAQRGTLACIKEVFEAATGITVDVNDKQTDGTIPSWEIQISPASGSVWPSYGRGFYAGVNTETKSVKPLRSAIAGPVIDALGYYGGFMNDHAWFPVDLWTMILLDKVRPAGTYYKFLGL